MRVFRERLLNDMSALPFIFLSHFQQTTPCFMQLQHETSCVNASMYPAWVSHVDECIRRRCIQSDNCFLTWVFEIFLFLTDHGIEIGSVLLTGSEYDLSRKQLLGTSIGRAAGMGIPMGIPMDMGMVWVWGLWWIPMGSAGNLCGFLNWCNFCGIETNSTNSEFVFS